MATHRPFRFGVSQVEPQSREEWVAYARKVEELGYSTRHGSIGTTPNVRI
jgi:hypothetical protein